MRRYYRRALDDADTTILISRRFLMVTYMSAVRRELAIFPGVGRSISRRLRAATPYIILRRKNIDDAKLCTRRRASAARATNASHSGTGRHHGRRVRMTRHAAAGGTWHGRLSLLPTIGPQIPKRALRDGAQASPFVDTPGRLKRGFMSLAGDMRVRLAMPVDSIC